MLFRSDPKLARVHSYLPLLSTQHDSVDDVDFAEHSLIPNIVRASTMASKNGKEWETHPTTGNLLLPVRLVTHQNGKFAVHDKYLPHDTSQTLEHILAHRTFPPPKSLGETLDTALNSEIGVNYSIPPELDHRLETDPESVHRDLPELWSPFDMHGAVWNELAGSPHVPRMSWHGLPHHVIINQNHFMGGNMAYHTQTERLHNIG